MRHIEDKYGYNGFLSEIREHYENLPRAYLDNAASPLILPSIPYKAAETLFNTRTTNPHSRNALSNDTTKIIDGIRRECLQMLNANPTDFELVFCSNATSAVKLVGEAIYESNFVYCIDSHTSLVGLRGLSKSFASFSDEMSLRSMEIKSNTVVSWPLQSNFDGKRYPGKSWSELVHEKEGLVLLDIASYAATEMPDLTAIKPDFAVLSFYKIFGFPDLGALIVRKTPQVIEFMRKKRYFGGGTVISLAASKSWMARPNENIAAWLEDGTLPIHTIITLKVAIDEFKSLFGKNFSEAIGVHTKQVAAYCCDRLSEIKNCKIFKPPNESPIVTFQLETIGHNEFAEAAALAGIYLRSGTLCNIGAFIQKSQITDDSIIHNYTSRGKKCNDDISFIDEKPTGVLRASFGPYSSYEDVNALIEFIAQLLKEDSVIPKSLEYEKQANEAITVDRLYVYPIKSCCGIRVNQAILSSTGLKYDRDFCLVSLSSKTIMSLKKYRSMAFLKPSVADTFLNVSFEPPNGVFKSIKFSYVTDLWDNTFHLDNILLNYDSDVVKFFSDAIGIPCTIAKSTIETDNYGKDYTQLEQRQSSSLANSSPLLIVTNLSGKALGLSELLMFRPNIVLNTIQPWIEDEWSEVKLQKDSSVKIEMIGKCRRCNMVCISSNGTTDSFPYMQLCKYRKSAGKIYFGQHARLGLTSKDSIIKEGDVFLEGNI